MGLFAETNNKDVVIFVVWLAAVGAVLYYNSESYKISKEERIALAKAKIKAEDAVKKETK